MPRPDLVCPGPITDSPNPPQQRSHEGPTSLTSHVIVPKACHSTAMHYDALRCIEMSCPAMHCTASGHLRSKKKKKKKVSMVKRPSKRSRNQFPGSMPPNSKKQPIPAKIKKINRLAPKNKKPSQEFKYNKTIDRNRVPRPPEPPTQSAWVSPGGVVCSWSFSSHQSPDPSNT